MRTFYIFKINNMFQTFYNDKSNILYKIFKDIYDSDEKEIINSFRLFERITIPFNKRVFNNYILFKHKEDLYYTKNDNKHIINNKDEVSKIIVNKTYLKIKSNRNINSFIKDIICTNECVFVIDFINDDYFWLNKKENKLLV